jgi:tRNA pseudouridine13 synthase
MNSPLPYAHGGPVASGQIKLDPEDFVVEEVLGFEPLDEGEHVFLRIEKRGENTDYLARQLAKYAGLSPRDVSYAGLKDRHGRTTQWFSVHLPGKREIDWSGFDSESVTVLAAIRHNRKLKKGALKGNRFEITARELQGDRDALAQRLNQIKTAGVPNYFGPQRFGRDDQNIEKAQAWFEGALKLRDRHLEGLYLSAARALIFNRVLGRRVGDGTWNRAIPGDVFMFGDSHSFFKDALTPEIERRLQALDIHPSAPLWGRGESAASDAALGIESETAAELAVFRDGLVRARVDMARRPLRLPVPDLQWDFPAEDALRLGFSLPAGAYATVVLREAILIDVRA